MEMKGDMGPRTCTDCGGVYTPHRMNQKKCSQDCPGRPDEERICANEKCRASFAIAAYPGHGRGAQRYCTPNCAAQASRWRLAGRFRRYGGMTPEQFQKIAEEQDGRCMICRKEPVPDARSWREGIWALEVDHDHLSGVTRDLLCGHCNKGIGHFMDDPELIRTAAAYIEHHRKQDGPFRP